MIGSRGGGRLHPLKNHKNIGFLLKTGPDPLKNHDDGPFIAGLGSSIPHQLKKYQIWTPSDKTFWISACFCQSLLCGMQSYNVQVIQVLQSLNNCWCSLSSGHLPKNCLSYDVASGSGITPCNKIDKPLVVH